MSRPTLAVLIAAAVVLACSGCGDTPVSPAQSGDYFRLVAVNGASLPFRGPPSIAPPVLVDHGDLLLRDDGRFGLGSSGTLQAGRATGTYRRTVSALTLTFTPAEFGGNAPQLTGSISADTLLLDVPAVGATYRLRFHRATLMPSVAVGSLYTLAAVNGRRAPLTLRDTIIDRTRFVDRILSTRSCSSTRCSTSVTARRSRSSTPRRATRSWDTRSGRPMAQ